MALTHTFRDQHALHFVTCTVHQWVDVFTRQEYADIVLGSLEHCQKEKGLLIYAWVIMTNHIHMIVASDGDNLSDIFRDFKKYTSKRVYKSIQDNMRESRKHWLLWLLKEEDGIKFWQDGYHAKEIFSDRYCQTKVNYIHQNPVAKGIVEKEEEYLLSSCGDFYGIRQGPLVLSPV